MQKSDEVGDYGFLWAWELLTPGEVGPILTNFQTTVVDRRRLGCRLVSPARDSPPRRHGHCGTAQRSGGSLSVPGGLGSAVRNSGTQTRNLGWSASRTAHTRHLGTAVARSDGPWTCELLLNEHREDSWVFRRDDAVALPLDEIGAETEGIPYLRPEIVLLYKAGESSPKSDRDFSLIRERLTQDQVRWLKNALAACYPMHSWIAQL